MFNSTELKFLEREILATRKIVSHTFDALTNYQMEFGLNPETDFRDEDIVSYQMRKLYTQILTYLEARNLLHVAQVFQNKFGVDIYDDKKALNSDMHEGDAYLTMLQEINLFLTPFNGLTTNINEEDNFQKLLGILDETGQIAARANLPKITEPNIYNAVNWVLKFYFDTRPTSNARFFGKFKLYKPDILIPEIGAAIEFKLIKKGEVMEEYIDQVSIDAINYKGDPSYTRFVAVICLYNIHVSKKDIATAWREKKFNENWDLVICNIPK